MIALGIGVTTTLFSVVNGVLLKPLPWKASDRLVRVWENRTGMGAETEEANGLTNITYNGASFTPESSGQGIRWYCVPHRAAGMVGEILLAGVTAPTPEKGILIRAYWIGIIGIAATLLWTIISYFIIKSSSRHFKDHHEHVRKGLP